MMLGGQGKEPTESIDERLDQSSSSRSGVRTVIGVGKNAGIDSIAVGVRRYESVLVGELGLSACVRSGHV